MDNTLCPLTFKENLSFAPLIRFWEKESQSNHLISTSYEQLKNRLEDAPELYMPIEDDSILEKHKELIRDLLHMCIPPSFDKFEYYAAVRPDRFECFYESSKFNTLGLFRVPFQSLCFNDNCCVTPEGKMSAMYAILLQNFYGLNINYEYPIIYTMADPNGLEKHYRIRMFSWFCDVKPIGELRKLQESEKKFIYENLDNPDALMQIVPPDSFSFEGFFIFNAVDVTDIEIISSLKFDLIEKESLMSPVKFSNLEHKVRVLMKKPEIQLGLIAFPTGNINLENAMKMGSSIILNDENGKVLITDTKLYRQLMVDQSVKIIYDMTDTDESAHTVDALLKKGIRNLLIAPLIYKGELIGIIEIGSAIPGDLNMVSTLKLKDVFPVFAVCIKTSLDDLIKSIQSVIKEKCTAIHPAVEWKFRDVALDYINNLRDNVYEEMHDIIFENIYPFYGASDVKDSSTSRNLAVQRDLILNLELARNIIYNASKLSAMPILEELEFRILNNIHLLEKGLNSGVESTIINFLNTEVESSFLYLKDTNADINKQIEEYRKRVDPVYGFLCEKRKDFEDSISLINEMISAELEIQQNKAQKIFPHYFEKYKTDGVEHNIYIGESITNEKKFSMMHLKSLRLWQLMTMCSIAQKCIELKKSMKVELDLTHLIFVQNTPMSIKFLYDEKKFDVAGSYDIRYEIIKKRLDKAELKDTGERVTVPGKIAIIYAHEAEASEYKQYINFLITKKYITNKIEEFELAGLQGIDGLKGMRITVTNHPVTEKVIMSGIPHTEFASEIKN